ncbi:MAG TPA: hypothetical protein VFW83_10455, partial [Bryobacteraceae bacterium]|nr:hypothetical protein [Bryobacteraceae bacterium]
MEFSPLERIILAILTIVSIWGFWVRFGAALHKIRSSRPAPGFQLRPIGKRIKDFLWEVMLQG